MSQRMPYTSQTVDLQTERGVLNYAHPEPPILIGGAWQSNMHSAAASGVRSSINLNQSAEGHDSSALYHMVPYDGVQNHAARFDMGASMSSIVYYPYLAPVAVPRVSAVPMTYGSSEQLISFSNSGFIGCSSDEYGRSHYKDHLGGSYKRKNAESTSTSLTAPVNMRTDGGTIMDPPPHALPGYRENDGPSVMDDGVDRSARVRSRALGINSIYPHNGSNMMPGSFVARSIQPVGAFSFDQPSRSNAVAGGVVAWNQGPVIPFLHGTVDGIPVEVGNMGVRGSHETDRERRAPNFLHPSHFGHMGYNNIHHQVPHVHGIRDHSAPFGPQVPAASFPVPHGAMNIPVDGVRGPRHVGSFVSPGFRMYQPLVEGIAPETNPIHCNVPQPRILPADEVAILDLPDYYRVGNHIDHHRDMRMDIEDMSYEDLLALGERIGSVNTGLSEETINSHLKTRRHMLPSISINLEEVPSLEKEAASCIICQDAYEHEDQIGTLNCGHEYHADCLKKWLLVKNVCPVCKSEGLPTARMGL
ncbi:probable E3 ubiquitin-protein ligase ZFP1 isoform X2 [Eucalyptus grandis]|uniref:probable E3 ubiquitin-protein ligase ZFP1 isoform X2 n=1 Tax=Eucalyptus grandis TaxID=71139 RepID=UPI00192ED6A8|nr:probable E3 ubiquitin-protein ligase ZFP1 isoform X2 [Eucalyptus grandis]